MSFRRLHDVVSYLIAGLGLFGISLGDELTVGSKVVIALAVLGSLRAEGRILEDPRWPRGWTLALVVAFAVQVARGVLGEPLLPLVLELTAALQISRLFNRKSAREHQQIAALALLHLIAATVLSTELSYAFAFIGFVIVAPWALALGHLRGEIEGQYTATEDPERGRTDVLRVLASKRVVGPRFLAGVALLSVPLFFMTGLVFLLFPRVGVGLLSFGDGPGQRVTGFGSNVELGDFGTLRTDTTVVVRVTPDGLPEDPPSTTFLRLRGTSFDQYDGRRWTRTPSRQSGIGHVDDYYPVPYRLPRPGSDVRYAIVLDHLEEPVIFLPTGTVGLEIPPRVTGGIDIGREILRAPGMDVRYADVEGIGLRYFAWISRDPEDFVETLDADQTRRYLQMPNGHRRVAGLAREWTEGAATDPERIRRILARLRSGDYVYSLDMPHVGRRLPLDVFLFDARRGHCEYFSTAMAIMLRSVGIPARNVTGFLGGTWNEFGGYYALRQGDAHSWVEAWLPGRGWVTLEPTPPSRDAAAPAGGLTATLEAAWDALATRWAEVVGYDLRAQRDLARGLSRWFRRLSGSNVSRAERPDAAAQASDPAVPRGWILGALLLVAAVVLVIWRLWARRPKAARPRGSESARRAVRLLERLDRSLARLGRARPPPTTPREHCEALAREGFGGTDVLREVTDRYIEARFGGVELDAAELARLSARVRAMERSSGRAARP